MSRRRWQHTASILGLALAAAAPTPLSARPASTTATSIPFDVQHDRLFIDTQVNGRPVRALLDSAAELSVLDAKTALALGIGGDKAQEVKGSGGTLEGTMADGVKVSAGPYRLAPQTVMIADLSDISRRLNGGKPIALILGRPFFDARRWTIDFVARRVSPASPVRRPAGQRLPLKTVHGIETMPVTIEGHAPAQAAFDLGNGSGVLIGKAYAARIGLNAPSRITGATKGGGLGGAIARQQIVLRTLTVAGHVFRDVPAAIDPTDNAEDVNIGTDILRHFRITTDYPGHAVWLAPQPRDRR